MREKRMDREDVWDDAGKAVNAMQGAALINWLYYINIID
jgi:hypothetical protein